MTDTVEQHLEKRNQVANKVDTGRTKKGWRLWNRGGSNPPTLVNPENSEHVTAGWLLTRTTEADAKKQQEESEKQGS